MGLMERPLNPQDRSSLAIALNPQDRSSLAIAPWIDRIDAN